MDNTPSAAGAAGAAGASRVQAPTPSLQRNPASASSGNVVNDVATSEDRGPSSSQREASILSSLPDLTQTDSLRLALTSPAAGKRMFGSGGEARIFGRGGFRGGLSARGGFRSGFGSPAQVDPRLSESLGYPDEDFPVRSARASLGDADVEARIEDLQNQVHRMTEVTERSFYQTEHLQRLTERSILQQRAPDPLKDVGKQTFFSFAFPHPHPQDRRQKWINILALEAAIEKLLPLFVAIGRSYLATDGVLTALVCNNQAIEIESLRHAGLAEGRPSHPRQTLSPQEQMRRFTDSQKEGFLSFVRQNAPNYVNHKHDFETVYTWYARQDNMLLTQLASAFQASSAYKAVYDAASRFMCSVPHILALLRLSAPSDDDDVDEPQLALDCFRKAFADFPTHFSHPNALEKTKLQTVALKAQALFDAATILSSHFSGKAVQDYWLEAATSMRLAFKIIVDKQSSLIPGAVPVSPIVQDICKEALRLLQNSNLHGFLVMITERIPVVVETNPPQAQAALETQKALAAMRRRVDNHMYASMRRFGSQNSHSHSRSPSKSSSISPRSATLTCHFCEAPGHIQAECPAFHQAREIARQVQAERGTRDTSIRQDRNSSSRSDASPRYATRQSSRSPPRVTRQSSRSPPRATRKSSRSPPHYAARQTSRSRSPAAHVSSSQAAQAPKQDPHRQRRSSPHPSSHSASSKAPVDFNAFPALVDSRDVHEHDEEQQHLPMYFSGFADVLDEVDDEQRRKRLAAGGMSSGTGSQRNASTAASYIAVPHGVAGEVAQVTPEISSDEATDARTNRKNTQADAQSNIFSDPGVLPRRPRFFNNVCTTICTALVALIFSVYMCRRRRRAPG